jgi:YHS domain-containing protein
MPDTNSLASRIDAEFSALEQRYKVRHVEATHQYQERQKRLEQLGTLFDRLRDIWKPRLEVLVKKFGDRVKVAPRLTPSTREATFEFESNLARISLKFSASTDRDVTQVVLGYDLNIIPVLTRFEGHSELAFPLDAVDPAAVATWVDDRIVSFVKTYLSLHDSEFYLKDQMVEDPVAGVRFPKFAAGATLEWDGETYYFVDEETRREFEKQQRIGSK